MLSDAPGLAVPIICHQSNSGPKIFTSAFLLSFASSQGIGDTRHTARAAPNSSTAKGTIIAKTRLPDGTSQMDAKAPGIPATAIPNIARSVRVMTPYLTPVRLRYEGPQFRGQELGPNPLGDFGRERRSRRMIRFRSVPADQFNSEHCRKFNVLTFAIGVPTSSATFGKKLISKWMIS
jgi:hypothetical protein